MKLENVADQNAFEFDHGKNQYHFHECEREGTISIDLKGRRLEYPKAHEKSIFLNAKSKGSFQLKPRVVFVDELGKYRSYEFEPQSVEVKELGFMDGSKESDWQCALKDTTSSSSSILTFARKMQSLLPSRSVAGGPYHESHGFSDVVCVVINFQFLFQQ
jgi:hypothetical protein